MNRRLTFFFFAISVMFVLTHLMAMQASLYWYFWWADIVMHFWGGLLIGLGVHVLAGLPNLSIDATIRWVLGITLVTVVAWEVFELYYGLYDVDGYWIDTTIDSVLGFAGAIISHLFLTRRNNTLWQQH